MGVTGVLPISTLWQQDAAPKTGRCRTEVVLLRYFYSMFSIVQTQHVRHLKSGMMSASTGRRLTLVVEADWRGATSDKPVLAARSEDRSRWLRLAEIALRQEQNEIKKKIRPSVVNYERLVHKATKAA